jgi:hypothetical protein
MRVRKGAECGGGASLEIQVVDLWGGGGGGGWSLHICMTSHGEFKRDRIKLAD